MNRRQLGVLLLLGAGGLAFFGLDLQNQLSLQAVQAGQTRWREWVVRQPVAAGLGYVAVYVAVTALSLPGAAVLTLLGGALFGLFWGGALSPSAGTRGCAPASSGRGCTPTASACTASWASARASPAATRR